MIISRAPVRITFAGGGTDIKSYYENKGGFLIACGINKYSTIILNRGYYDSIHLKYSKEERVVRIKEIEHPIFREAMYLYGKWDNWAKAAPIEIVSMADYPVGCGLGTSGSFTVALVNGLLAYQNKPESIEPRSQRSIAERACHIEIDILKEPIGKQDQYAAAFGGLYCYTFTKDGLVSLESLKTNSDILNERIVLFDTGISRRSSDVLTNQVKEMESKGDVMDKLDKVKDLAVTTKKLLEKGKYDSWGDLLNYYWEIRKTFSNKISNPQIDEYYETALKNGALGGKLQGAGGGGFLMFYTNKREQLIEKMESIGLKYMPFKFDFKGVSTWRL